MAKNGKDGMLDHKSLTTKQSAWFGVFIISVIIISGICSVWNITLRNNNAGNKRAAIILNKENMNKEINYYLKRSDSLHLENPIFVPTGVFIDAVKFLSSSDILMSGLI